MYTLRQLPKRRFARYWLQPVPGQEDYDGPGIKERGTTTYKGRAPKPAPPSSGVDAVRQKGDDMGTRRKPFPSRMAALRAGNKPGDRVYFRRDGKKKLL